MANNGTQTVTTTDTPVFLSTTGCTTYLVHVLSTSAFPALVHIDGLHDDGEYLPVPVGNEYAFRLLHQGIKRVVVKGDGGSADINHGVIAITPPSN